MCSLKTRQTKWKTVLWIYHIHIDVDKSSSCGSSDKISTLKSLIAGEEWELNLHNYNYASLTDGSPFSDVQLRLTFASHSRHSSNFHFDVIRQTLNDIESLWRVSMKRKGEKKYKVMRWKVAALIWKLPQDESTNTRMTKATSINH